MTELIRFVAPRVVKFTAGLIVGYIINTYVLPAAQAKLDDPDEAWEIFHSRNWER